MEEFWKIFVGETPDVLPAGGEAFTGPGFYSAVKAGKPATPRFYTSDKEVIYRLRKYLAHSVCFACSTLGKDYCSPRPAAS